VLTREKFSSARSWPGFPLGSAPNVHLHNRHRPAKPQARRITSPTDVGGPALEPAGMESSRQRISYPTNRPHDLERVRPIRRAAIAQVDGPRGADVVERLGGV